MVKKYNDADVFVFPSLADGMGLVALEAMASGLPVICTENCGCKDMIDEGKNGYVSLMESVSK